MVGGGGVGELKRVAVGGRVGMTKVGNPCVAVGKPKVGNRVNGREVMLGSTPPMGVVVGGSEVAVTICGPGTVAVGVGAFCGAVPHRIIPAQ